MTSFITDAMVEAAWRVATGARDVGASDGHTYVVDVPTRASMRAALEAAMKAAWRPASECPSDGSMIIAYRPLALKSGDEPVALKRAIGGNRHCWPSTVPAGEKPFNPTDGACHVTLFMPLPPAPEATP